MFHWVKAKIVPILVTGVFLGGIWIMFFSKTGSGPGSDPIVQVKVPRALSADAITGQKIFEQNCSSCHGKWAGGSSNGPPLVHGLYEPNHHADAAFFRAAKQGVRAHHWPFGNMPPVKGVTQNEVESIVSYVRTLQRENGIF